MKKHDEYPALKFTCRGGPLDGETYAFRKARYVPGGPTPDIAEVIRDGIRISTFRRVAGVRVPISGRYQVTFHEADGSYAANHEPSEIDAYYKAPELSGPEIALGDAPPAPRTFGKPVSGVIPQPVSTLNLNHGQG